MVLGVTYCRPHTHEATPVSLAISPDLTQYQVQPLLRCMACVTARTVRHPNVIEPWLMTSGMVNVRGGTWWHHSVSAAGKGL